MPISCTFSKAILFLFWLKEYFHPICRKVQKTKLRNPKCYFDDCKITNNIYLKIVASIRCGWSLKRCDLQPTLILYCKRQQSPQSALSGGLKVCKIIVIYYFCSSRPVISVDSNSFVKFTPKWWGVFKWGVLLFWCWYVCCISNKAPSRPTKVLCWGRLS